MLISSLWLTLWGIDTGHAKEYLRITGELDYILRNRLIYWQAGLGQISLKNIFGDGPLAKFGGQLTTKHSGYDRDLNMHNAYLSVFQYYGWPGGILFIIFLASVGRTFLKRRDPYAALGLSLLAFGLLQCMTENWLLSFGIPGDAFSWFILGLTLTHNSSNNRYQIA